jgi:hypothetical protein
MNIWRIAGVVATFCALTVVVFYVTSGKLESWSFQNYWLKIMLGFFSFRNRGIIQNKTQKANNDILGIFISFILVTLLLWLGKTYF